jgi:hypothetical protein
MPAATGKDASSGAAKRVGRKALPWLEGLVRSGYAAKGLIYGLIGVLALLAAFHLGGKLANQKGAVQTVGQFKFGGGLLIAIAVGLAAYSTWRLFSALMNPEGRKPLQRIAYGVSALAYYALGYAALQAARGVSSQGASPQKYAGVVEHPLGRYAAIAVGIAIIGVGVFQIVKAYTKSFMKVMKTGEMTEKSHEFAENSGRIGYGARGVVFFIIGWMLLRAGFDRNANEAGGISKALQTLALQPYGRWLLAIVAMGLLAYGLYMFVEAQYRRIEPLD